MNLIFEMSIYYGIIKNLEMMMVLRCKDYCCWYSRILLFFNVHMQSTNKFYSSIALLLYEIWNTIKILFFIFHLTTVIIIRNVLNLYIYPFTAGKLYFIMQIKWKQCPASHEKVIPMSKFPAEVQKDMHCCCNRFILLVKNHNSNIVAR